MTRTTLQCGGRKCTRSRTRDKKESSTDARHDQASLTPSRNQYKCQQVFLANSSSTINAPVIIRVVSAPPLSCSGADTKPDCAVPATLDTRLAALEVDNVVCLRRGTRTKLILRGASNEYRYEMAHKSRCEVKSIDGSPITIQN